ncbi:hypothetical protein QBC36DRAFT_340076 [Triangularia setosa]|uniref:Uncharacterized protein n=1 Tax=Triangularia setosa TaxID=2587417 RepID=A0AAN6W0B8_9PEZI|nr:hypothetical protein QBC36DRAFT_340076 [Podospora setosa]
MTNFLAILQALGGAANQAAAIHGPGFVEQARGFSQEAARNFQQHCPVITLAAMGAAGHAAKYIGKQVPFVVEHAAATVVRIGLLTAAARKELEAKHPDILAAIQNGAVIVLENAEKARCWAAENPGKIAIIIGGLILVVNPGLVSGPAFRIAGFGQGGVTADSIAAFVQSYIGNVAVASTFAIFQSAGAGDSGLAVVNGVVQAAGVLAVSGTMLLSFLEAQEEEKRKV